MRIVLITLHQSLTGVIVPSLNEIDIDNTPGTHNGHVPH